MSMQDPVSDMLTRIRNAHAMSKDAVIVPASKMKIALADVLKEEGFIEGYEVTEEGKGKNQINIFLKYYHGEPVIKELRRVSKSSLRVYKDKNSIKKVRDGLGVAIISTSKGLMSDKKARLIGEGGEVICEVY